MQMMHMHTKALVKDMFVCLRKLLMGWQLLLVIVGVVIDIICYMIYMFRNSTLMSILPMVHEGVR